MENYAKIEDKVNAMSKDIAIIKNALIGNTEFKQKGIIHTVAEHAEHIEGDKKFKNKLAGGMAIGIPAAAGAWALFVEWVKNKL